MQWLRTQFWSLSSFGIGSVAYSDFGKLLEFTDGLKQCWAHTRHSQNESCCYYYYFYSHYYSAIIKAEQNADIEQCFLRLM